MGKSVCSNASDLRGSGCYPVCSRVNTFTSQYVIADHGEAWPAEPSGAGPRAPESTTRQFGRRRDTRSGIRLLGSVLREATCRRLRACTMQHKDCPLPRLNGDSAFMHRSCPVILAQPAEPSAPTSSNVSGGCPNTTLLRGRARGDGLLGTAAAFCRHRRFNSIMTERWVLSETNYLPAMGILQRTV